MASPTVSILLPVYNGAAYLARQIDSVLAQTFRDFEFLITDDASTDGSWDIIAQHFDRDPRIVATRSAINAGQEATLLSLVARSRGDRILFCDQDDVWHPDKVRHLLDKLGCASLAYGPSPLIDGEGLTLGTSIAREVGPPLIGRNQILLLVGNVVSAHAMAVRRELVTAAAFAPSDARVLFDWRLAAAATFAGGLVFVEDAVTYHRLHGRNRFNADLRGLGKRPRRSHRQHLDSLIDIPSYLAGHPSIRSDARAAFASISAALSRYAAQPGRWHVRSRGLVDAVMAPLRSLSDNKVALDLIERKVARVARGWLHPAYWWGEHKARRRPR